MDFVIFTGIHKVCNFVFLLLQHYTLACDDKFQKYLLLGVKGVKFSLNIRQILLATMKIVTFRFNSLAASSSATRWAICRFCSRTSVGSLWPGVSPGDLSRGFGGARFDMLLEACDVFRFEASWSNHNPLLGPWLDDIITGAVPMKTELPGGGWADPVKLLALAVPGCCAMLPGPSCAAATGYTTGGK